MVTYFTLYYIPMMASVVCCWKVQSLPTNMSTEKKKKLHGASQLFGQFSRYVLKLGSFGWKC
jgi:hypothetical protein